MNIIKQNSFDCFFKKTIDYIVYETNHLHTNANNLDGLTYFYYLLNIHRFDNLPALKRRGFPLWAFFVQNG
jgi:hypothetical protein